MIDAETSEEAVALIQARDDGSLIQSSNSSGGEKWSDFEGHYQFDTCVSPSRNIYILKEDTQNNQCFI